MPRAGTAKGSYQLAQHKKPKGELLNGWPTGPRKLACLGCGRRFTSRSRANRLCRGCSDMTDVPMHGVRTGGMRSGWME